MEGVSGHVNFREMLEAQAFVWNHLFQFINSMSLKCAVELGIPDTIHKHGQPMTLSQLVDALPTNSTKSPQIYRLMRILVKSGFFALVKVGDSQLEEGYVLTPASRILLKDNPVSVAPFLLAMLDPVLTTPWQYMSLWFQNDDLTPFMTTHQTTIWGFARKDERFRDFFNEAMASDSLLVSSVMVSDCKGVFEGVKSLVDVGGGTGTMCKAIAKAFPDMFCTVFDLPHVVANLEGSGNLKYVEGDMFEAIPPAEAIMLKWTLHSLNDEDCVKILKQCKQAIIRSGHGGKVIVIDIVVKEENGLEDQESSTETQLFFDMLMTAVGGRERSEKEWAKLVSDSGFSSYNISYVLGLRSLIEVYP